MSCCRRREYFSPAAGLQTLSGVTMVIGTVRLYDSRSVQWQWVSCSMRLCGNTIAQYYIPKISSCRITGCHFSQWSVLPGWCRNRAHIQAVLRTFKVGQAFSMISVPLVTHKWLSISFNHFKDQPTLNMPHLYKQYTKNVIVHFYIENKIQTLPLSLPKPPSHLLLYSPPGTKMESWARGSLLPKHLWRKRTGRGKLNDFQTKSIHR